MLPPAHLLLMLFASLSVAAHAQAPAAPAELVIGTHRIAAEVADTPAARAKGLMHRKTLPEHGGMVFAHADSRTRCMWMKNTLIPLSVAFIDEHGRILNIEDMQPGSLDRHCSAGPARFALEMNLGWFRKNGVQAGDTVAGLARLPPAGRP